MTTEQIHSEEFVPLSGSGFFLLVGGSLILLHVLRAWRTTDRTAEQWLVRRSLPVLPGAIADVRAWLVRMRWARAAGALVMVAVAWAAMTWLSVLVGFAIAPYVLSVLVAEHFLPPPAGSGQTAVLEAREIRQYVPSWAVWTARLFGAAAAAMSLVAAYAALGDGRRHVIVPFSIAHAVSVSVALLSTEAAHRRAVSRARPSFPPQDQVDHALRVASTRSVVGAFVAFASFALVWSYALLFMATASSGDQAADDVLFQALTLLPQAGLIAWLVLLSPQRARPVTWRSAS